MFFGKADSGNFMHCEWDPTWSSVVSNSNGSSGWARILRSGGDDVPEGVCRRVHLCAWNPCNARWAASKHGVMGPPIHLQPVTSEEVSFGPKPPAGAPLHSGNIPPPATCDPQLRALASQSAVAGAMQQTQDTIYSAEYWPWPEKSDHRGHMWVIVSLYCWGLQENANRMCGRDTTE